MKIFSIAKANIFKSKGSTLSLFIIIMLASILSSIGLSVIMQIDRLVENKSKQLNSLHNLYVFSKELYKEQYLDYIKNDSRVSEYNFENIILMPSSDIILMGETESQSLFFNLNNERTISTVKMIEQNSDIAKEQALFLPYYAKIAGYNIGDNFPINFKNKQYNFKVAGFFDTMELAEPNGVMWKFYLYDEGYNNLAQLIGESHFVALRLYDASKAEAFNTDFLNAVDLEISAFSSNGCLALTYSLFALSKVLPINSIAAILVAFAFILTLMALLVIYFRVVNNIEDNIKNIGILGALGYTSGQIVASNILEYLVVSVPSVILGMGAATLLMPGVQSVLSSATGMIMKISLHPGYSLLAALSIVLTLIAIVLIASRRIKQLPPVIALRGGVKTHSFRLNFFPLHKGFGTVDVRLGLKNMFVYGKLYLMIGLIIAAISLVMTFVVVTYSNFVLDQKAFIKMIGLETADITIRVTDHTDADAFALEVETMNDVRKTSMMDWVDLKVEGNEVLGLISYDFSAMEIFSTYEGVLPKWDNEIVLAGTMAKLLDKKIGDLINVKAGGITKEYLICGLISTTNNLGRMAAMTYDGYKAFIPGYQRYSVNVYLKDAEDVPTFISRLEGQFGVINVITVDPNDQFARAKQRAEEKISYYMDQYSINNIEYAVVYKGETIITGGSSNYQIKKITNYRQMIKTQINALKTAMSALTQFISVICILIVSLILYMTTSTIIIKRKVELGILKANGYHSKQLATHMAISYIPASVLGSVFGCLLGAIVVNPVFSVFFSKLGVAQATFDVNPVLIVCICVLLLIVTVSVSLISALRIKKVSVYQLLSE